MQEQQQIQAFARMFGNSRCVYQFVCCRHSMFWSSVIYCGVSFPFQKKHPVLWVWVIVFDRLRHQKNPPQKFPCATDISNIHGYSCVDGCSWHNFDAAWWFCRYYPIPIRISHLPLPTILKGKNPQVSLWWNCPSKSNSSPWKQFLHMLISRQTKSRQTKFHFCQNFDAKTYDSNPSSHIPLVPHKAVAEVSKIGN